MYQFASTNPRLPVLPCTIPLPLDKHRSVLCIWQVFLSVQFRCFSLSGQMPFFLLKKVSEEEAVVIQFWKVSSSWLSGIRNWSLTETLRVFFQTLVVSLAEVCLVVPPDTGRSQNSFFSPAALLSRPADSHSPYQLCPDSVLTCACQPSARPLIPRPFPWCPGIGLWPVFFLLNGCLGFTPFLGSPRSCLISSCDDILL